MGAEPKVAKLIDGHEVGEILHQSYHVVMARARTGEIPSYKLGHKSIRFHPRDVAEYIAAHRRPIPDEVYDKIAAVLVDEADSS